MARPLLMVCTVGLMLIAIMSAQISASVAAISHNRPAADENTLPSANSKSGGMTGSSIVFESMIGHLLSVQH